MLPSLCVCSVAAIALIYRQWVKQTLGACGWRREALNTASVPSFPAIALYFTAVTTNISLCSWMLVTHCKCSMFFCCVRVCKCSKQYESQNKICFYCYRADKIKVIKYVIGQNKDWQAVSWKVYAFYVQTSTIYFTM